MADWEWDSKRWRSQRRFFIPLSKQRGMVEKCSEGGWALCRWKDGRMDEWKDTTCRSEREKKNSLCGGGSEGVFPSLLAVISCSTICLCTAGSQRYKLQEAGCVITGSKCLYLTTITSALSIPKRTIDVTQPGAKLSWVTMRREHSSEQTHDFVNCLFFLMRMGLGWPVSTM